MALTLRVRRLLLALLALTLLVVSLAPGSASAFRRIHHADPKKAFAKYRHARPGVHAAGFASSLQTTWPCTATTSDRPPIISSNAPQVKVIYAYPTEGDQFATFADLIQADAKAVEDRVGSEPGAASKSVRFDRGGTGGATCNANPERYLDIQKVALNSSAATYNAGSTFTTLINELRSKLTAPAPGARVNYVVYADRIQAAGAAGEADLPQDDSHDLLNSMNQGRDGSGRLFAIVYGNPADQTNFIGVANAADAASFREATFLHELSHNLGAVQMSAPNTSQAGHCLDENDIMCYDDNGPGAPTDVCLVGAKGFFSEPYDCNHDDYFNQSPSAGSYLATHWNTFDSVFLCLQSGCESSLTPPPAITFGTTHVGGRLTFAATPASGSIAHYEWDIDGDGFYDVDTGTTPQITPDLTFITPRTVLVRASKSDGTYAFDSEQVTPVVPGAAFTAAGTREVGQTLQLDATNTTDPDGLITKFRWDLDGDGSFETDTGLVRTTSLLLTTAGQRTVRLEVDFPLGFSQAGLTVPVAPATPLPTGTPGTGTPVAVAGATLSAGKVSLPKLIKSGMPFTITCRASCTINLKLAISAKLAKKFRIRGSKSGKSIVIGKLTGTFAAGTIRPKLKLTTSAKKGLKKARSVKTTLTGSVNQPPNAPLKISKAITFKR